MLAASSFCRPPKCSTSRSMTASGSRGTLASRRNPRGLTAPSSASTAARVAERLGDRDQVEQVAGG